MDNEPPVDSQYKFDRQPGNQVGPGDLAAAVELLRQGDAVDPQFAANELPNAMTVVLVKLENQLIGVGAIKRSRPWYAKKIQKNSNSSFPSDLPELGYIVIATDHQGQGLSKKILAELLRGFSGSLFATTDNSRMKQTLSRFDFASKGQEWRGGRGRLSLWLRSDTMTANVRDM